MKAQKASFASGCDRKVVPQPDYFDEVSSEQLRAIAEYVGLSEEVIAKAKVISAPGW